MSTSKEVTNISHGNGSDYLKPQQLAEANSLSVPNGIKFSPLLATETQSNRNSDLPILLGEHESSDSGANNVSSTTCVEATINASFKKKNPHSNAQSTKISSKKTNSLFPPDYGLAASTLPIACDKNHRVSKFSESHILTGGIDASTSSVDSCGKKCVDAGDLVHHDSQPNSTTVDSNELKKRTLLESAIADTNFDCGDNDCSSSMTSRSGQKISSAKNDDRPSSCRSADGPGENVEDLVSPMDRLDIMEKASMLLGDLMGTSEEALVKKQLLTLNNLRPAIKITENSDSCEGVGTNESGVVIVDYQSELQMPVIMALITRDLSEPYSIYTYRYFIHNWPHLCFLAKCDVYVGAIVCKLDLHKKGTRRGYIAMLAVDQSYRRKKIGTLLVEKAIDRMIDCGCDEVVLETEVTNSSALRLYEKLGFVRDKRLYRYYLNGVDAFRLRLWLNYPPPVSLSFM